MIPQFTIRDLLWLTAAVLLFAHAASSEYRLGKLKRELSQVERVAWGGIGNDRGLDLRMEAVEATVIPQEVVLRRGYKMVAPVGGKRAFEIFDSMEPPPPPPPP